MVVKKFGLMLGPLLGLLLAACSAEKADDVADAGAKNTHAMAGPVIRFATYNTFLNRREAGGLIRDLKTPDNVQAQKVAEIIQRAAPDILVLNEVDYDEAGEALALFEENYLAVSQNGAPAIRYEYRFLAPINTGVHSGYDLNKDGVVTSEPGSREYGGDAFGYGEFPGQYGIAVLSRFPIDEENARTFQKFLWRDMPGALLPDDWYSAEALKIFRLSSKSHWDVPVMTSAGVVHVLASHPTPPSFDGPEDRNGKRNFDENRFWADYIDGAGEEARGAYIYDDKGARGGLKRGARFVIMGDLNADPNDADSVENAIGQLLNHERIAANTPESAGGNAAAEAQAGISLTHKGPHSQDTADFNDDPERGVGNLRLDYVLPSKSGFAVKDAGVFWPAPGAAGHDLIGPGFPVVSSDHRMVWTDLQVLPEAVDSAE